MKIYAVLFAACLAALASATAAQPLSLTPLGTVKSGPFRADDPRVAEINAGTIFKTEIDDSLRTKGIIS